MARRVTDPDELQQAQVDMFRFHPQELTEWFDGELWVLREGEDYPVSMPYRSLRGRLRTAAYARGGSIQMWRSGMDEVRLRFIKKDQEPA